MKRVILAIILFFSVMSRLLAYADDTLGLSAFVDQKAVFDISFIVQDVHEYGILEVERIKHTTSTETFKNRTNNTEQTQSEKGTVYRDIHAHIEQFNANVSMNAQAGASVSTGASVAANGGSVTASGNQQVSMNASQNFSNGGHATINYSGSTTVTATAGQPNPS